MPDTIPLAPEDLARIAGGETNPGLGTVRALIDHLRWVEAELDYYQTLTARLNDRIRAALALPAIRGRGGEDAVFVVSRVSLEAVLDPIVEPAPEQPHVQAHVPDGRGTFVRERGGLRRVLLSRLTDGRVMCCICYRYVPREGLYPVNGIDGVKEDRCIACALLEADRACADDSDVVDALLDDPVFLDALAQLPYGRDMVLLGLQSLIDMGVLVAQEQQEKREQEETVARAIEAFYSDDGAPLPQGVAPVTETELRAADELTG